MISGQLGPSRHQGRTGLLQHGLSYVPFVALWPWKTLNTGAKRLRKGGGEVGVLACRPREGPTAADVTLPTR